MRPRRGGASQQLRADGFASFLDHLLRLVLADGAARLGHPLADGGLQFSGEFRVLGGLTPKPGFAVPTSIGYGMAKAGVTALSSMLVSCAPGTKTSSPVS